jgi:hypothetical protein
MKHFSSTNLFVLNALVIICGCSSAKKTFYFDGSPNQQISTKNGWSLIKAYSANSKQPISFNESKSFSPEKLQASTGDLPQNESEIAASKKYYDGETKNVNEERKNSLSLILAKETHSQKTPRTVKDETKGKIVSAKLGFGFSLAGFLAILGVPILLSSVPLLVAFLLFTTGFILSIIGLKSEKRKLAIAGIIISGAFLTLALIGMIAVFGAFGGFS